MEPVVQPFSPFSPPASPQIAATAAPPLTEIDAVEPCAPSLQAVTPRGSSVTSESDVDSLAAAALEHLPPHPPSPRARTRGETKYRTPRPESTLTRLPRGFVWSDPEAAIVEDASPPPKSPAPARWCHVKVPENTVYLVERGGIFNRALEPGIRLLVPGLDRVAYAFSKKMQKLTFATSNVPTSDRVSLNVKATLFYMVDDPIAAAYAVENMREALIDLAAAAIHDEFGRTSVKTLFADLDTMWGKVAQQVNEACCVWGTRCIRFFTAVALPPKLAKTYERLAQLRLQREIDEVTAVRDDEKRDKVARAKNEKMLVAAEARGRIMTNESQAERDAILMKGEANARALRSIADALERPSGRDAARVWIASKYIDALSIGLKSNRGSVSIDASGPARIVDEALNIMDAQMRRSRSTSRARSNDSPVSPASPYVGQRSRQRTTVPDVPTSGPSPLPPSPATLRRWESFGSTTSADAPTARQSAHVQARRARTNANDGTEGTSFSIGGSHYFNTSLFDSPASSRVPPPTYASPVAQGSKKPPKPCTSRRSRPKDSTKEPVASIDVSTLVARYENVVKPEANDRQSPVEFAGAGEASERTGSGLGAAIERVESGPTIERVTSGATVGDDDPAASSEGVAVAAAALSPHANADATDRFDEDLLGMDSSAIQLTLDEVRAETASPAALVGWNTNMPRRRVRRRDSGAKTAAALKQIRSPHGSNMTEEDEHPSSTPPPRRASIEFRRRRRGAASSRKTRGNASVDDAHAQMPSA